MDHRQRRRRTSLAVASLEDRLVMTAPVLDPIASATVPAGKTLMVPLTSSDADGNPVTYTVTSDNGNVLATVKSGQPFIKMAVAGYGDMTFQLFDDLAPVTVEKISGLIKSGFYDGLTFHRIIKDFMIQGGDPKGDGSGGPGFTFDDEFSPNAIFSGVGQLAMANSGKDTNGSQFFVTQEQTRFLDYNHTIYGQLLRGFDVLSAMNGVPTPVTITSVSMVTDTTDAVLMLKGVENGVTSFTVTATDSNGETDSKTFSATAIADTTNDPAVLGPVSDRTTVAGKAFDIALSSFDLENDPVVYGATVLGTPANATVVVNGNIVTVTPNAGFVGTFDLRLSVQQKDATDRGSTRDPNDYQTIKVTVTAPFETQSHEIAANESAAIEQFVVADFVPNFPVAESVYTANIDWGDGTTTQGTITGTGSGRYEVAGSHTYARFGTYPVSVKLDDTFQNFSSTVTTHAVIADAPLAAQWVQPEVPGGIGTVSGVLAKVTDSNPTGAASDLSAVITWGDGATSPGTINVDDDGRFLVSGSRNYLAVGSFEVKVTVTSLGGATAVATGQVAIVNDAPVFAPISQQVVDEGKALEFQVSAQDPNAVQGQSVRYQFIGPVPQFVTIDSATGIVRVAANAAPGSYDLVVRALDNGTPAASALQTVSLKINNKIPVITLNGSIPASLMAGDTIALTGSIADLPGSGPWNVQVDYGTGEGLVPATYSSPTNFSIRHTYANPGNYQVNVVVTDGYGGSTSINSLVAVNTPAVVSPVRVAATRDRSGRITSLQVFFSSALDPASAKLPSNYGLTGQGGRAGLLASSKGASLTRFRQVSFDAATNSVTLTPAAPIALRGRATARVLISGLKDARGRLIDGNRDGAAGGDLKIDLSANSATIA